MKDEFETYLHKQVPAIPADIQEALETAGSVTEIPFAEKNRILCEENLQSEAGILRTEDGNWLIAMTCPMPGITPDMLRWWFWWHPQEDIRYQIWFPGAHKAIGYRKKDAPYFRQRACPPFQDNVQYPTEAIGSRSMPQSLAFQTPSEFGFSEKLMAENDIPLIICGHVGMLRGMIMHTEMAHIFKQTEDGGVLISRFWLGNLYRFRVFRRRIFSETMAMNMAKHCCQEYRNLAQILPELYRKYAQEEAPA